MKQEFRVTTCGELRASADARNIEGYAALFDSDSQNLGGFVERIRPGAFARALREKQDVRCLFNHDPNNLLGRLKSGTLQLNEDSRGLRFVCELPQTSYARDLAQSISRGDISGCSFGFTCKEDSWPKRDLRELVDVDLFDVGPVTYPAYPETSVAARSLGFCAVRDMRVYSGQVIAAAAADSSEVERLRLRLRLSRI